MINNNNIPNSTKQPTSQSAMLRSYIVQKVLIYSYNLTIQHYHQNVKLHHNLQHMLYKFSVHQLSSGYVSLRVPICVSIHLWVVMHIVKKSILYVVPKPPHISVNVH
eukprot:UN09583